MIRLFAAIFLTSFLAVPARANVPVQVRYYADETGKLPLEEILKKDGALAWTPLKHVGLSFGETRARIWYRFEVPVSSLRYGNAEELFVEVASAYLSHIHLYVVREGLIVRDIEAGFRVPISQRSVDVLRAGFPIFRLTVPRDPKDEYFVSIEGTLPLSLPLRVWEAPDLALHHWVGVLFDGLILGCLLLGFLSNGVLGLSLRSRLYLTYSLFVFAASLAMLSSTGLSSQLLWPESPWWNEHEMVVVGFFAYLFYTDFVRGFLDSRRHYRVLDRLLLATVVIFMIRTIWLLIAFDPVVAQIGLAVSGLGNLISLALGLGAIRKRVPGARLFVAASLTFDVAIVLFSGQLLGWFWLGDWITQAPFVGTLLEVLLLTFALADRLRTANRELASHRVAIVQAEKIAALGRMAGEIAHEINNPLAIIHGNASLIRREPNQPQVAEFAATIESTANRISKVVKGMRSLSRDSRRDPLVPVAFDVILQDAVSLCRESAHHRGVQLEVAGVHNLTLRCRSSEICQVLVNLITNALDAVEGREGARVWLETSSLDGRIEIAVLDNGPGVPQDARTRLLEPFFTTKEPGKGLGLGLSISRTIVEGHGGELWYDERSRFTRFAFTVPVQN